MANVIITFSIMPESPDVDLDSLTEEIKTDIKEFTGNEEMKTEMKPMAFGLKSLIVMFVMDEQKGTTDALEEKISRIEGIKSVEVTDVRRAIG
ncbi:elongation factor 1-beta [Candidatus Woesearchaeota archaeon]|nr:elongation factor 1-beta [Candidatus Woesearchaeota archaeon]